MLLASSACPSLTARTRLSNRGEAAGPSSSSRLASAGTPSQRRRAARGPARVSAVISEGVTQTVNRGRFPHFDFLERTYDATHADRLEKYFDTMPFDPFLYKDGHKYRKRCLSTVYEDESGKLHIKPGTVLLQSKDVCAHVNKLYGGVVRKFDDMNPAILEEPAFRSIWDTFVEATGIDPTKETVYVHQMRTICSPTMFGDPTPEGIHQDGYSAVGIFCAGRRGVRGAATSLFRSPRDPHPLVTKVLERGDAFVANDKAVFHFTGVVEPEGGGEGTRDVFVLVVS